MKTYKRRRAWRRPAASAAAVLSLLSEGLQGPPAAPCWGREEHAPKAAPAAVKQRRESRDRLQGAKEEAVSGSHCILLEH